MKKEPKEQNCPHAGQGCSIKEFMRMNPPSFAGGPNPMAAENWIQEIEEIMEKIEKFTNLIRGDLTVAEYAAKFVELSRFTPFLVPNKIRKARKFDKGLRRKISKLVVGFQVQNFSKLVDKASVLEKSIQGNTESIEQKKRLIPSSFQSETSQGLAKKGKEEMGSVCPKCDKRHRGECWYDTLNCYRCNKPGHHRKDCREPLPMVATQNQYRGSSRYCLEGVLHLDCTHFELRRMPSEK
ncbi:uncharacterized protein LOC131156136 [Malania oleifera]|uniref:uncharacterized protein LOC131156136 n=1 Tax=Malania oleifera TaxID=397392 RepID=UPI0025AE305F|nr:uncharacterized protein LOC131156136 [Malania oleifera]